MTVDPAEMWAYATRPIGKDEDAPLLAVLAAADRAAPRVRRVPGAAMVDGRFEVPPRLSDEISEDEAECAAATRAVVAAERASVLPEGTTVEGLRAERDRLTRRIEDAKKRTRRDVAGVIT